MDRIDRKEGKKEEMGLFDNLKDATFFEQGEKLPDGDHLVEILECKSQRSAAHSWDLYIVEYTCCESKTAIVGKQYGYVIHGKDVRQAQGNIKQFCLGVMGADEGKNKAHYDECLSKVEQAALASVSHNLFKGKRVRVNVATVKTKGGYDFKRHQFYPAE